MEIRYPHASIASFFPIALTLFFSFVIFVFFVVKNLLWYILSKMTAIL